MLPLIPYLEWSLAPAVFGDPGAGTQPWAEKRVAILPPQDLMGGPKLVDDGLGLIHRLAIRVRSLRSRP